MLIHMNELMTKFSPKITGILHCGAHLAEEAADYKAAGVNRVVWVEGNEALINDLRDVLRRYKGNTIINALLSDAEGEATFHITRDPEGTAMSSSILELEYHKIVAPWVKEVEQRVVPTTTIDRLAEDFDLSGLNFINLDLQGAELLALKGGQEFLNSVDYIYTEINRQHLYTDCVLIGELDSWLSDKGFSRVSTVWTTAEWGDAFYVRTGK